MACGSNLTLIFFALKPSIELYRSELKYKLTDYGGLGLGGGGVVWFAYLMPQAAAASKSDRLLYGS